MAAALVCIVSAVWPTAAIFGAALQDQAAAAPTAAEPQAGEASEQGAPPADVTVEGDARDAAEPPAGKTATDEPPADQPDKQPTLGEPLAPGMVKLLQQEIVSGLTSRGIMGNFHRFEVFAGGKLDSTARPYSGSEVTGNCRLRWYDHLLRNPLAAPAEAEQFTRELHRAVIAGPRGLGELVAIASEKLDLGKRDVAELPEVESPQQALDVVEQALLEAQVGHAAMLAPLGKGEIRELSTNLYPVLVGQNRLGHTLANRSMGRRLCDVMEKLDRKAMLSGAAALAPLADPQLLDQLKSLPQDKDVEVEGATGRIVARIDTPAGTIVIGGDGQNSYQLDKMTGVSAVVDLGGDDVYYDGTCTLDRPVLVVLDLAGRDVYRSTKPAVQGSAILGISMLVDREGNDVYQAQDMAQGSCLAGVGILIDMAGDDKYIGLRRVQGQAFCGLGLLVDRDGSDDYRGALWTQGFGGPMGLGLLDDLAGTDHYYTGGLYPDSYDETPGYEGWGQGVGAGPRQVANGGLGVILDGGGDDVYEFDYLAHGGGYWCGVGFARDFGGNDQRLGATRVAYGGGPRTQSRFQRFGNGYACHYAVGFCFDDQGDDSYGGTIMGTGFAWDCSAAYLCDFGGNDHYTATGGGVQGNGAQAGLGVLFDYDGDDVYEGYGQANASPSITYHDMPGCGGNFSFVVDYGGTDTYGCRARNNSYNRRGSAGGFLIDRPKRGESEATAEKRKPLTTAGS